MKISAKIKAAAAIFVLIAISAVLFWAIIESRKEPANEDSTQETSTIKVLNGESIVTVDSVNQNNAGIVTAPIKSMSHQEELEAYGVVLQMQDLADLFDRYVTARTQMENENIKLKTAQKEYERQKALVAMQGISAKEFEDAEAAWRSEQNNVQSFQNTVQVLEGTARQQWGDVIARWLFLRSPALNRLIQRKDILIQVTLPAGSDIAAPHIAYIQTHGKKRITAKLISSSPHTDTRIQGLSFFCVASSKEMDLLPGMDVTAFLPSGIMIQGFFIPDTSIVWYQGSAWVYVKKNSMQFSRRAISTSTPLEDGYFTASGFSEGTLIVVKGAQSLLSEEFRQQIQSTGDGKGEKD